MKDCEGGVAPPTQEVGCVVGVVECHCVPFGVVLGIVCGLPVGFRWSVERMGLLEEQDSGVAGVFWPLPSGPASGPLNILNARFRL